MPTEEKVYGPSIPFCRPGTGEIGPAILLREGSGSLPFVSVILATRCDEKYIDTCLNSILSQNYPPYRMEILVVDGMSTDATRRIVHSFTRYNRQIRLLDNPERHLSCGLNKAIQASRGAYILRLDPRAEYGRNYVKSCIDALLMTGADNVGGPQRHKSRTFFQRMVSIALESWLSPGERSCPSQKDGYVNGVFPGAFRRQALQRVGLFDPGATSTEDEEINQRILSTGGKMYLSTAIECYSYPRERVGLLAAQYFRHGHGHARTMLKHGQIPSANSTLPFALLCALGMLLFVGLFTSPALWLAACTALLYGLVLGAESMRMAFRRRWQCAFILPFVFSTMHLAHAAGMLWGLLYYSHNPDWTRITPPLLQH